MWSFLFLLDTTSSAKRCVTIARLNWSYHQPTRPTTTSPQLPVSRKFSNEACLNVIKNAAVSQPHIASGDIFQFSFHYQPSSKSILERESERECKREGANTHLSNHQVDSSEGVASCRPPKPHLMLSWATFLNIIAWNYWPHHHGGGYKIEGVTRM